MASRLVQLLKEIADTDPMTVVTHHHAFRDCYDRAGREWEQKHPVASIVHFPSAIAHDIYKATWYKDREDYREKAIRELYTKIRIAKGNYNG